MTDDTDPTDDVETFVAVVSDILRETQRELPDDPDAYTDATADELYQAGYALARHDLTTVYVMHTTTCECDTPAPHPTATADEAATAWRCANCNTLLTQTGP